MELLQYKLLQYKLLQYKLLQYKLLQYKLLQYKLLQYKLLQYKLLQYKLLQYKFNPRNSSQYRFARVTTWQARVRNCMLKLREEALDRTVWEVGLAVAVDMS